MLGEDLILLRQLGRFEPSRCRA